MEDSTSAVRVSADRRDPVTELRTGGLPPDDLRSLRTRRRQWTVMGPPPRRPPQGRAGRGLPLGDSLGIRADDR